MPTTLTELKQSDIEFFRSVKHDRVFYEACARHGFSRFDIHGSQRNAVFVITKAEWDLPLLPGQTTGLNIHFDARRRTELRIEIGLRPYVGNVEWKSELLREVNPVLRQKEFVLELLRYRLTVPGFLPQSIRATASGLLSPDKVKAHTIVKFTGDIPDDPTPAETARLFAAVIDAVTPLIQHILDTRRMS